MGSQFNRVWSDEINGQRVFVKQYLPRENRSVADIQSRVEREAELLRQQETISHHSRHLGALRLVNVDSESCEITTAFVNGSPLEDLLSGEFRTAPRKSLRALFLAGRWLQHFQALETPDADNQFTVDTFVEYCDIRIDHLLEGGRLSAADREIIRSGLFGLLRAADKEDHRTSWCHCDYAPFNLFWDGDSLTPLDFEMCKPGPAMSDVTYFIHRMEMLQRTRPWKSWPINAWRGAFLRGYGRDSLPNEPIYKAWMLRHALCRMLSMHNAAHATWRRRLHDIWMYRTLRTGILRVARQFGVDE